MSVEYRDVEGFPGYRVGSDGTLWSCKKREPERNPCTGNIRKMRWTNDGEWRRIGGSPGPKKYRRTVLCDPQGKRVNRFIHNLVCEAFHGPRPGHWTEWHACHTNGDPLDNRAKNLRWATPRENNWDDQIRHGTHTCIKRWGFCPE